ncbi:hypothetical protein [Nocardia sp. AG03]|uniref:hypothetical protein n=1 Tax=Nocardia sp. AG03 TaxID=3025312 RepID=UPI0024183A92|nr:hypothetical protein [Nocardia sp. AG03]
MTNLPLARTNAEARLFLRLRPCAQCGARNCAFRSSVVDTDGPAARYRGECESCGAPREYVFRLPDRVLPPPADAVRFGGDESSELLDPGEWLSYSRICAEQGGPDTAAGRHAVATAVAAVAEVLKFLPPGADSVPATAFFAPEGLALFAAEPGSFDRDRLDAVSAHYRALLARWSAVQNPPFMLP